MNIIKPTFYLLLCFILQISCGKKITLNNPESVVYEKDTKCYFISNVGNGTICKKNNNGTLKTFASGYNSFLGIAIHNGIVYVAEDIKDGDDFIRGFNSKTGEETFTLPIKNSKQLNDIVIDNDNNLYVSDRVANKIYKVVIDKMTYKEIVSDTINTPNGLFYDANNNCILVCNTVEKSSIYQINLSTNKVSLLVNTNYPHLDGITMDLQNNIYASSWAKDWKSGKLLKYNGDKLTVVHESKGIADIYYNKEKNSIDITNFYANTIQSIQLN